MQLHQIQPSLEPAANRESRPPVDGQASVEHPSPRGTFRIETLGCKINQYESEWVRELFQANGFRPAGQGETADIAIVNTCTVTAEADRKSRHLARRLASENPGVRTVVMGCYAAAEPAACRELPNVVSVIEDKRELAAQLAPLGIEQPIRGIRSFHGRHRAFVKVQDGCLLDCTYCIIPRVRPHLTSRPIAEVVEEVERLVEGGMREIVLTGIHLGHYGIEPGVASPEGGWRRLSHLLEALVRLPGRFRIRLSSLEASEITPHLIGVLAEYQGRVCPHLHLSLQSGSDRVLRRMRRRYRIARFLDQVAKIRDRLDEPAFSTDIIVGFPGETEQDFLDTLSACSEAGFMKIHIFPFSPRRGTPAATMSDLVPADVVADRRQRLTACAHELFRNYAERLEGRRLEMLVESPDPSQPEWMRGTACRYVPLRLRNASHLEYELVSVRPQRWADEGLEVAIEEST